MEEDTWDGVGFIYACFLFLTQLRPEGHLTEQRIRGSFPSLVMKGQIGTETAWSPHHLAPPSTCVVGLHQSLVDVVIAGTGVAIALLPLVQLLFDGSQHVVDVCCGGVG